MITIEELTAILDDVEKRIAPLTSEQPETSTAIGGALGAIDYYRHVYDINKGSLWD